MQEVVVKKRGQEVKTSWFFLSIAIAVVLSFVICLLVVNLIEPVHAQDYSKSGIIKVDVKPEPSSDSGTIRVEVNEKGG